MFNQKMAWAIALVVIGFVGAGDRVLPAPFAAYSFNARTTLLNMLPTIRQQNYNQKTEEAVEQLHDN